MQNITKKIIRAEMIVLISRGLSASPENRKTMQIVRKRNNEGYTKEKNKDICDNRRRSKTSS